MSNPFHICKIQLKKWMAIISIKGGFRRLMENSILNFHFVFRNPALICYVSHNYVNEDTSLKPDQIHSSWVFVLVNGHHCVKLQKSYFLVTGWVKKIHRIHIFWWLCASIRFDWLKVWHKVVDVWLWSPIWLVLFFGQLDVPHSCGLGH